MRPAGCGSSSGLDSFPCDAADFSALKVIAPGNDMRARDEAELLLADDAGETHEVADGVFADPLGARVFEFLEPPDLGWDVGEAMKFGCREPPVDWRDFGGQLNIVHG
jgi:hypothetical protein